MGVLRLFGSVIAVRRISVLLSSFAMLALTSLGHIAVNPQMHGMEHMGGKQVVAQSCQLICGGMYAEKDKLLLSFEDNKLEPLPPLFSSNLGFSAYSYILILLLFAIAYRSKIPIYRLNQCLRM
jgi:hypothetical protein